MTTSLLEQFPYLPYLSMRGHPKAPPPPETRVPSPTIPHTPIHHHPFPIPAPAFDHHPRHALDIHHDLHHPQQNQTCVPALIPPGMDPSQVDIRTFYPYTPNEVKHRKRTTSTQLKVLESIFRRDTKPNAALRNELALQLDMTARGVQVRFSPVPRRTRPDPRVSPRFGSRTGQ